MGIIPSFYEGHESGSTLFEGIKSLAGLVLLGSLVAVVVYGFINWQKNGRLFGSSPYKNVGLIDLLSYANVYDGKKVCTKGFYVSTPSLSIIKVSLNEDEFTRSAWVKNSTGDEIIISIPAVPERYIEAELCGYFESGRAGEFGNPSVWNHQITVEKFQTFGDPQSF